MSDVDDDNRLMRFLLLVTMKEYEKRQKDKEYYEGRISAVNQELMRTQRALEAEREKQANRKKRDRR